VAIPFEWLAIFVMMTISGGLAEPQLDIRRGDEHEAPCLEGGPMKVLCSLRTLFLIAAWAGSVGVVVGLILSQLAASAFF
jgi:hypothetical protein